MNGLLKHKTVPVFCSFVSRSFIVSNFIYARNKIRRELIKIRILAVVLTVVCKTVRIFLRELFRLPKPRDIIN